MKKIVIVFTILIYLNSLFAMESNLEYIKKFKERTNYSGDCIHENNSFNFKLINKLNGLCFLIYMKKEHINYTLHNPHIYESENKALRSFVLFNHEKKEQYVVIRGSHNFNNWISNFTSNKIVSEKLEMTFHNGFHLAATKIYENIKPILKEDYKTTITGHSLGGALAVIVGMFLDDDYYNIKEVVTFGQPRVTDLEGKERINNSIPIIRVLNDTDVVTLVPTTKVMEFYHAGLGLLLLKDNKLAIDKGEGDGINHDRTAEEEIILKNSELNDPRIDEKIYFMFKLKKAVNQVSIQMHYPQFYSESLESKFDGYEYVEYTTRYNNAIEFLESPIVKRYSKQLFDQVINLTIFQKYYFDSLTK